MLTSLLATSDLSSRSEPAVRCAVQLARAARARLTVLHVVEEDQPVARMRQEMRSAQAFLDEQVASFGRPEACEVSTRAGNAFQVISDMAQTCAADLIVLGAYRRLVLRDVFVGTTIERVIRTAGRPVLIANGRTAGRWKKILIATDRSETSAQAARTALSLGLLDGADVTFVHAYIPVVEPMMTHAGIPRERAADEAEREFNLARLQVADFIRGLGLGDRGYTARTVEGPAAAAIASMVDQWKPDLLVIGTRGNSAAKRLFLGSVAQELMSHLAVDILAVPPKPEAT